MSLTKQVYKQQNNSFGLLNWMTFSWSTDDAEQMGRSKDAIRNKDFDGEKLLTEETIEVVRKEGKGKTNSSRLKK